MPDIQCRERSGKPNLCCRKAQNGQGLKLEAEIEVRGMHYPVHRPGHQKLNDDGSLTLRPNLRPDV
jgi:hypothetical protein